jgi:predicted nuclease of predicted toxin-antitoxin system
MKFLLDVGITPQLGQLLESDGHIFRYVPHCYSTRISDAEIMAVAHEHGEVVITHDLDFGTLLAFSHAPSPSVILFRLHQINADIFYRRICQHWGDIHGPLQQGALVVIELYGVRIRRLPI